MTKVQEIFQKILLKEAKENTFKKGSPEYELQIQYIKDSLKPTESIVTFRNNKLVKITKDNNQELSYSDYIPNL